MGKKWANSFLLCLCLLTLYTPLKVLSIPRRQNSAFYPFRFPAGRVNSKPAFSERSADRVLIFFPLSLTYFSPYTLLTLISKARVNLDRCLDTRLTPLRDPTTHPGTKNERFGTT